VNSGSIAASFFRVGDPQGVWYDLSWRARSADLWLAANSFAPIDF
jgi:hypothetical protein